MITVIEISFSKKKILVLFIIPRLITRFRDNIAIQRHPIGPQSTSIGTISPVQVTKDFKRQTAFVDEKMYEPDTGAIPAEGDSRIARLSVSASITLSNIVSLKNSVSAGGDQCGNLKVRRHWPNVDHLHCLHSTEFVGHMRVEDLN